MNKDGSKKRIAFLGGGAHTIPSYRALLTHLALYFDLTVYSEFNLRPENKLPYKFKSVPAGKMPRRVRELLFALMIVRDLSFKGFYLLHAHSTFPTGFFGIILGKIFRIPVVVSLDAAEASVLPEINFGDLLNPKRMAMNKWVIQKATHVIVLTNFQFQEVKKNLDIQRKMHIIPRGVDTIRFVFSAKKLSRPLRFINVAYLSPVKDQETLLRCFAIINAKIDCELIHIGEDFENGRIQQLAKSLGIDQRVRFKGLVSNEQLPVYYAQADILLHTSLYESQAVVVCEAMASGVLVCGTHVGLLADLSGVCCLTVQPRMPEELANLVLNLINDPARMERLCTEAYAWATAHSLQWTVKRHLEIYNHFA
jgi:glycosyltransferase involved in cell wall biosynthesis